MDTKILNKLLFVVLALAVLGTVVALIFFITAPPVNKFTEFYILGMQDKAMNYPERLKIGEDTSLTLGIINQEQTEVSYRVEIRIDGILIEDIGPVTLEANEKREQKITFALDNLGDNQKVEFLLYKQGQSDVYESLHLLVDGVN